MRIPIVSRCWCCDTKVEETMTHLFLTAPIATRLWRQFAIFAGINIDGMHLQQLIITWWNHDAPTKLQVIYRVMPALIMWTLWKRRNTIKHGGNTTFTEMVSQIHELIRKVMKLLYPRIRLDRRDCPDFIAKIKEYKPKLYVHSVVWKPPVAQKLKCNTDGASRGNPGMCSFSFCIRDDRGDIRYARAKRIGITTNTEAEVLAIHEALEYNYCNDLMGITIETDSLSLKKMILNQWKVPWEIVERIEDIRQSLQQLDARIIHIFREGNTVADSLANEVIDTQYTTEYNNFQELPSNIRRLINMDKAQMPNLRIRNRHINTQSQEQ
uniref:RNase H family protein n=1 Tax=Solanum tuberosum TaxID=4113 RepID=M1BF38_SOLTU